MTSLYSEFVDNKPLYKSLDAIRGFRLVATIPKLSVWSDQALKHKILDRMHDRLLEVVRLAGFFFEYELKPSVSNDKIRVLFDDDVSDFDVSFEDGEMTISRGGSQLDSFFDWYMAFMPSAGSVITDMLSAVTELTGRKLSFTRVRYEFDFIIYDVQREGETRVIKNIELMHPLIKGFPDDRGFISSDLNNLQSVSRADFAVSRWMGTGENRRLARFSVQAPANRQWTTVWFYLSYGSESYTDPQTGERSRSDPDRLFSEWREVLTDFLRDKALAGFVEPMVRGYRFASASSTLP